MLSEFDISNDEYINKKPYPHYYQNNILDEQFAKELQSEIMNLPIEMFDRYDNPFEQKYTLRDKNKYPPKLQSLINYLISDVFVSKLSSFTGHQLLVDTTKNFYGVHMYKENDKLDIHVDAGIHPVLNLKKQITLGIYLSYNWTYENGCALEIWDGDDSHVDKPKIYECVTKIHPMFNRLILFTCTDNAWHGNPDPVHIENNINSKRIFITLSYLSNEIENYNNKRKKAYFIARPNDPEDLNKDKLRDLRANPETCNLVYRTN
jgi:Rps23 Pro-64 3,4-dihydroxylase Tpa1-like proline 4-hydroxylase